MSATAVQSLLQALSSLSPADRAAALGYLGATTRDRLVAVVEEIDDRGPGYAGQLLLRLVHAPWDGEELR